MITNKFATLLRQRRTALNLSQSKIAKLCFLSKSSYNQLENGLRLPSVDTLLRISNVLDVDPSEFIYAIMADKGDDNHLSIPNYIKEDLTPTSQYSNSFIESFNLLDKFEQKAIVDIMDSILSTNDKIK